MKARRVEEVTGDPTMDTRVEPPLTVQIPAVGCKSEEDARCQSLTSNSAQEHFVNRRNKSAGS